MEAFSSVHIFFRYEHAVSPNVLGQFTINKDARLRNIILNNIDRKHSKLEKKKEVRVEGNAGGSYVLSQTSVDIRNVVNLFIILIWEHDEYC